MKYTTLAIGLLLSGAVSAGETSSIDIKVTRDGGDFSFSSADAGFNPMDLQVGENRAYVDEKGRNVLITRTEAGLTIDADGEQFDIPAPGVDLDMDLVYEHAVEVEKRLAFRGPEETVLITKEPVDPDTQAAVRQLLKDAGHDAEVRFVDGSKGPPGSRRHELRLIR